jgi:hypothetical protein
MYSTPRLFTLLAALLAAALLVPALPADPEQRGFGGAPTSFTYQGRLEQSAAPLTGLVDMDISLWSAATEGTEIGPGSSFGSVPVTEGEFSIEIPVLEAAFTGGPVWLEIAVGPVGGSLTPLTPRRPITPAPQASFSNLSGRAERADGVTNDILALKRLFLAQTEPIAGDLAQPGAPITFGSPVISTIDLSGPATPFTNDFDVFVSINIQHVFVEDVTVTLTSPDGTTITLFEKLGGGGDDIRAEYSALGTGPIEGSAPFNQSMWDAQVGSLEDFRGENIAGVWTLNVSDDFEEDDGVLVDWFIIFQTAPGIAMPAGGLSAFGPTDIFGRTTLPRELNVPNGPINAGGNIVLNEAVVFLRELGDPGLALGYFAPINGPLLTAPSGGTGVIGAVDGIDLTSAMLWTGQGWVGIANTFPDFPLQIGQAGDTANGNGAHVTTGGTWTNGSSRTWKSNFRALDPVDVLNRLVALPVTRWEYTGSDEGSHIGPVAEDFHAAFGTGDNEKYISTVDADGVAFAAIQGLNAKLEAARRDNVELRRSNAELEERIERLERLFAETPKSFDGSAD